MSEERSQQGRAQPDMCRREQGHRLIREGGRRGRDQAIRTVIGLGTGLARVLASRRDIFTAAMFDRQHPDRRPQKKGEAGEDSGTGKGH